MTTPPACLLHTFAASGHLTQQSAGETANPLLSLPPEMLDKIIQYTIAANTPRQAAVTAIQWGRVALMPHLLTHDPRVEGVINHAKHLDEALIILWNHIAPNMTTAPAIRLWMTSPNNAPLLGVIRRVDLAGRGLKIIPPEINTLSNLEELRLEHNQITQVPPQAFAGCSNLRSLHLGHNQIAQVAPQAFAGCSSLESLHLEHNQIARVAPQAFAGCSSLEWLYLEYNKITQVAPQAFAGCSSLRTLHLEYNKITQVDPQAFAGCLSLEWLHFEYNQIAQVDPQTFAGCLSLESLNLGHNQITQVAPQTFAGYLSLWMLSLNNNKITQVTLQTFAGCSRLQTLHLEYNKITQVAPQAFAGCLSLERLSLEYNKITRVDPQTFAGCLRLETLSLEHNQIAQVPPQTFAGCLRLEWLHLGNDALLCKLNVDDKHFLTRFNAFSGYVCRSEFAAFYKAVSEGRLSTPEIVEHLKRLEEGNLIYEMVYWEAVAVAKAEGRAFSDEGDPQWGAHHVCDDMPIFCRALKRAVQEKFNRFPPEQKCAVHGNIYRAARDNAGPALDAPEWDDPNWGGNHREDNVLMFIDAMQSV